MRRFLQQTTRYMSVLGLFAALMSGSEAQAGGTAPRSGLHGYVHNTEGGKVTAIAGAEVQFLKGNGEVAASVKTDKGGYYSAPLLAGEYTFQVTAAGYKPEKEGRGIQFRLSQGYAVHNFTLIKGKEDPDQKAPNLPFTKIGEVRGQVYEKTPEGELKGVNGAVVTLRLAGGSPKQVFTSPPSEDGEFPSGYKVLMAAGMVRASISAPGFDTLVHPERIEVEADKMTIQDFVLTRPTPTKEGIKGIVRVMGGDPLPDSVKVLIYRTDANSPNRIRGVTPVVDTEGKFEEVLAPGRYVVTAEAVGYVALSQEQVEVLPKGFSNVTLTLRKANTVLNVAVLDAETRKPIGQAFVRARLQGEPLGKADQAKTDAGGKATFAPKAGGNWQVLVQMTGYSPAGKNIAVPAGKTSQVEVLLLKDKAPGIQVTVLVQDPAKQPLADAKVVIQASGVEGEQTAQTKADGQAVFTLPTLGGYRVLVTRPGFQAYQLTVKFSEPVTRHVVTLYPYAGLRVQVVRSGTKSPIADATVVAEIGGMKTGFATGPDGVTQFKFKDGGTLGLTVMARGFETFKADIKLLRGENDRTVALNLSTQQPTRLQVVVKDKAGRIIPEAAVTIDPPVGRTVTRMTDFDGQVREEFSDPGVFDLMVRKQGFEPYRANHKLNRGDNARQVVLAFAAGVTPPPVIDPTIPPPKGDLLVVQVVDAKTGLGLSGASIRVVDDKGSRIVLQGQSDEAGFFRSKAPLGRFQLMVSRSPFEPAQQALAIDKGLTNRKVSLTRTGAGTTAARTINVLVREAGKKNVVPIEGAAVSIMNEGGKVVRTGTTNSLGRFRADKMPVGVYTVRAVKAGYTQVLIPRSDITKGDDQPEVLLQPQGVATKPPDPAAELVAVPNVVRAPQTRAKSLIEGVGLLMTVTNPKAQGEVTSQAPVAGQKVRKGTSVSVTLAELKPPPTTRTLTVKAEYYTGRKPFVGATITVKNAQKQTVGTARTNASGQATFSTLPPGIYTLEASGGTPTKVGALPYTHVSVIRADLQLSNGQATVLMNDGPIVK